MSSAGPNDWVSAVIDSPELDNIISDALGNSEGEDMSQDIYHVRLGTRRTTVSLDKIISTLLSLKLGCDPKTEDAHSAVRAYLQDQLDHTNDPDRTSVSQWLREEVLLDLVDKKLATTYWRWFDDLHLGKKRRSN